MARDFENLHDIDDLSDDELRRLVREQLRDHRLLYADDISVHVTDGEVRLSGRVGTESERRVAEHVVTDVLGVSAVRNELRIDALHRRESPEAIDSHLADEEESAGILLGDRPVPMSPESEHLREDLDARLFGTTDVGQSIADGTSWIPPEGPTPEGLAGNDAQRPDFGEDH
jgi:hypothetical protein